MNRSCTTLGEALAELRTANGLVGEGEQATHWYPGAGVLHVRLPNFAWRQRALARHDAHHLLTGYPCTRAGEMQMAAWEFAAGRYPHAGATLFCLPLVGMGAIAFPGRTFAAFLRGRRGRSLYAEPLGEALLRTPLADVAHRMAPPARPPTLTDLTAYATLVLLSLGLIATPFALACLLVLLR